MIDPREVFATLRDSCLAKTKDIRDFVIVRYDVIVGPYEIDMAKCMRAALEEQLALMEAIQDKLRKS